MKDEVIGNFRIVDKVGAGGMGEVYIAEQKDLGTRVAIKVLLEQISRDRDQVQRFFNEARAVSKIPHGGIVKISDAGFTATGRAYLVMELLDGETLSSTIAQAKRLTLAQISEIGTQIASILDATHKQGITHRDLKPDNIFLVVDAERASGRRVKILDFGIAKLTGTLGAQSPNTVGAMGTPAYMAPEQWGEAGSVDWRADLYSLGCVIFEMACGRTPFVGAHFPDLFAKVMTKEAPKVSDYAPGTPQRLDALVARLLAKKPEDRGGMKDVQHELAALGEAALALGPVSGDTGPGIDPATGHPFGMRSPGGAGRTWHHPGVEGAGVAATMPPDQPTMMPVAATMPPDQPTVAPDTARDPVKKQELTLPPIAPTVAIVRDPEPRDPELPRRRFPIAILVGLVVAVGAGVAIFAATRGKAQSIDAGVALAVPAIDAAVPARDAAVAVVHARSCEGLAERVAGYASAAPKLRPAVESAVRTVIKKHCEVEAWAPGLRACVAASNGLAAALGCLQPLGQAVIATYGPDLDAESARTESDWVVVDGSTVTLIDDVRTDGDAISADTQPLVAALARVMLAKHLRLEISGADRILLATRAILLSLGVPQDAVTLVLKPVVGLEIRVRPSRVQELTGSAAPRPAPVRPAAPPPAPTPTRVRVTGAAISITEKAQFKSGSIALEASGTSLVADVASIMKDHGEIAIEVQGHTDATEAAALGDGRARSIAAALVAAGIPKVRMTVAGFGANMPIATNANEDGRAANRRVEIHVVQ